MKLLLLTFLAVNVVLFVWWYFGIERNSDNVNSEGLAGYSLIFGGAFVLSVEAIIIGVFALVHWLHKFL